MTLTDAAGATAPPRSRPAGWWVARLGEGARAEPLGPGAVDGLSWLGGPPESRAAWRMLGEPERPLPDRAAAGACAAIVDGVLYNRRELSECLGGPALATLGDAALVLRAYLRWGESSLDRIKGVFALILLDGANDRLLCARDPLGVYPLFWADAGPDLLFSTSVEALVAQPGVSRALNRAALADHLCHRWPKIGETYYGAVRRVPPGHVLWIDRAGRRLRRYWDPAPPHEPVRWIRRDELGRFDELLDQAVGRCLELGPAGVFLSGGLDSVTVAAVAADQGRRRGAPAPHALSLIFPDPESNEEPVQRSVAAALGLPQTLIPLESVDPGGVLAAALELSAGWPWPLLNFWLPGYDALAAAAQREGCAVILTGGGGDEWLGVSPFYAADLLGRFDLAGIRKLYLSARRSYTASRLRVLQDLFWTFGGRLWLEAGLHRLLRQTAPGLLRARQRWHAARLTPHWIAPDPALRRELSWRAETSAPDPVPGPGGFYAGEMRPALDHALIAMDMEEQFECGRRRGMRILQPFWDAELIDLLYRTPPELLNLGGRAKGLVRHSLARRFPDLGFERQRKVTASTYFRSVALHEGARAWDRLGGAPALADLGVVDARALDATISAVRAGDNLRAAFHLWDVLNLETWVRRRR